MKFKNIWLKSSLLLSPLSLSTVMLANIDSATAKTGQNVQKAGEALKKIRPSEMMESLHVRKFHQQAGVFKSSGSYRLGKFSASRLDIFGAGGHALSAQTNQYMGSSFPLKYVPNALPSKVGGSINGSINARYLVDANFAVAGSLGAKGGLLSRSSNTWKQRLAGNGLLAAEARYGEWVGSGSFDFTLSSFFSGKEKQSKGASSETANQNDTESAKKTPSEWKFLEGARGFEGHLRTPSLFNKLVKLDVNGGYTNRFSKLGADTTAALPKRFHVQVLFDVVNLVRGYLPMGWEHFCEFKLGIRGLTKEEGSQAWSFTENVAPAFIFNIGDFRAKVFEHNARLAFENSASLLKNDLLETSWTRLAQVPSSNSDSNKLSSSAEAVASAQEVAAGGAEAAQKASRSAQVKEL